MSHPVGAHYFSIPKTASTTAREVIKTNPCFHERIQAAQHRSCNGTNPAFIKGEEEEQRATVATIREPCAHFVSVHRHLQHQTIKV
jgi:hypothetical protein